MCLPVWYLPETASQWILDQTVGCIQPTVAAIGVNWLKFGRLIRCISVLRCASCAGFSSVDSVAFCCCRWSSRGHQNAPGSWSGPELDCSV